MSQENKWVREPIAQEQLDAERARSVAFSGEPDGGFTCDACTFAPRCVLAFDGWNTNGDCLAEK